MSCMRIEIKVDMSDERRVRGAGSGEQEGASRFAGLHVQLCDVQGGA